MRDDIVLVENSRRDGIGLDADEVSLLRQTGLVDVAPGWEPGHYALTARSMVGRVPLPRRVLVIQPKTPVANLFAMLARTAGAPHLTIEPNLSETGHDDGDLVLLGLVDLYTQALHAYLARGLCRRPLTLTEASPFVRGKLLLTPTLRQPATRRHLPITRRDEWSADTPLNQALKQACRVAVEVLPSLSSPPPQGKVAARLRQLHSRLDHARHLLNEVSDVDLPAAAIDQLEPTRLEADAAPALTLARWLLAGVTPALAVGPRPFPAFWLDMARLFETFVACLVRDSLTDARVTVQRAMPLDQAAQVPLRPDVVVERPGRRPLVLDTKYKTPGPPDPADLYQLLTYCQALGAAHGALVYPAPTDTSPLVVRTSGVTVHSLGLDLGAPLAEFGAMTNKFLVWITSLL